MGLTKIQALPVNSLNTYNKKMVMIWVVLGVVLLLIVMNFYFRYKTFQSLDKDLDKIKWKTLPKEKYVRKCYDLVEKKFTKVSRCWLKYPWRNFYYRNIWTFEGNSLSCLLQNKLFQRCLLRKLKKDEIKTVMAKDFKKGIYIHFYSKVRLNGKWVDIDVWGKKWGIPFGKNIHNSKVC